MINFIKEHKYTLKFIFYFIIALICFQFNTVEGIEATVVQGFSILFCYGMVALSYMNDQMKDKNNDIPGR